MTTSRETETEHAEELAILVHGTYAGADTNTGDKWSPLGDLRAGAECFNSVGSGQ